MGNLQAITHLHKKTMEVVDARKFIDDCNGNNTNFCSKNMW